MIVHVCVRILQGGTPPMTSSMDDSDDEFDQLAPPDNELDKVHMYNYCTCMYSCT